MVELEDYGDNVSYAAVADTDDDPDQWYQSLVVFRQRQAPATGCLFTTSGDPVALSADVNAIESFLVFGSQTFGVTVANLNTAPVI